MSALLLEPELETLPACVLLRGVSWEQYEALDRDLDGLGARLAYLDGTLEIMSPISSDHEGRKSLIGRFVEDFCLSREIEFWEFGSSSLRLAGVAGEEPDEQFHFHEEKRNPDLAIEIMVSSGGIDRLALLHRFRIAEIWIWKNGLLCAYQWRDAGYEEITESRVLPGIDLRLIQRCAEIRPMSAAIREFRRGLEPEKP